MTAIKAVLFDWGETLVHVPGMGHSPARHIACLEQLFGEERGENGVPDLRCLGVPWPVLRGAYLEACRKHIAHSAATRREHRFEDRFATTLKLLEIEAPPEAAVLSRWVERFAELIAQDAEMVDGADEVVEDRLPSYPTIRTRRSSTRPSNVWACAVTSPPSRSRASSDGSSRIRRSIARRSIASACMRRRRCSSATISTTTSGVPRRWGCAPRGSRASLRRDPPRPTSSCPICAS